MIHFNLEKYLPEQHHHMQQQHQQSHQYQHQQQAQLPPPPQPPALPLQQQLQLHQTKPLGDMNLSNPNSNMADINQFSSSTEDIFDLLLQFEREPSNSTGLDCNYVLDQDDQVGIENIRKQLMSYDVQSLNQHQIGSAAGGADPMSPTPSIVDQNTCNPQPQQQSTHSVVHHPHQHQTQSSQPQLLPQTQPQPQPQPQSQSQSQTQNLPQNQLHIHQHQAHQTIINQTAPVINQHQQQTHQMPTPGPSPTSSAGQSMLLSSYSSSPIWNSVQQQQQQPQSTSPQLHHSCGLHERQDTPSLSVSPQSTSTPAATNTQAAEPSPVVKRNPLLNAQLVNSFNKAANKINSQNNSVLNQNPILNAKLSQSPFLPGSSDSPIPPSSGSPVSPNFNSRGRFMQQARQSPSFNYEMSQHQQQQQQQSGHQAQPRHMSMFGSLEQPALQVFRTSQTTPICTPSPTNEGFSQQVKQEMRRKQSHETSLLKQLLSDDN